MVEYNTTKPLGWWVAQGYLCYRLDGQDHRGPCELPDGRVVCGPHGCGVCKKCDSDYTGINYYLVERRKNARNFNPYANSMFPMESTAIPKREIGAVFPTEFVPLGGSKIPTELFPGTRTVYGKRFVHRDDPRSILIFTDGSCFDNGRSHPRAGWGFVYGPRSTNVCYGRLESRGPSGCYAPQTSNRAELRAVIAALHFRHWFSEGFDKIPVATDSEYVVKGSTRWARGWIAHNWTTTTGRYVQNRDLWEELLSEVERWDSLGLSVRFWRIPRDLNKLADEVAKQGAENSLIPDVWVTPTDVCLNSFVQDLDIKKEEVDLCLTNGTRGMPDIITA
ncbi:ribonuclease H-like domain-containing protein [Rostrohypoxylon terebratum]|nr:ribonuclease H-like domain-containing protein [Rostrohypoxylon terebratum]